MMELSRRQSSTAVNIEISQQLTRSIKTVDPMAIVGSMDCSDCTLIQREPSPIDVPIELPVDVKFYQNVQCNTVVEVTTLSAIDNDNHIEHISRTGKKNSNTKKGRINLQLSPG